MNNEILQPLINNVMRITTTPSIRTTICPQITVARAETPSQRRPVLYQPSIVIVLQGSKKGYIGDRVCIYDADNYFVSAIPMQFECETLGTKENPLISISVKIELPILREMVLQIDMKPRREKTIEA